MSRGRIWHAPIRFEQRLAYRPRVGRLRHCVRLVILSVEHVGMVPAKFFMTLAVFQLAVTNIRKPGCDIRLVSLATNFSLGRVLL